ncbi:BEM_collapsed_G0034420.mRNA.1.CDS.1 [Saccharomyces cerevisiae]|nr:BEM_HP_G0160210.mRNA.1.CDS.1 [Saccharomyces cerevisiae]CAI5001086.1 BEM_HP_G0012650.mRNA.1.CDS.1 [Saccharomyces cerevisiae]CAI5008528.1 BEM_HP_G0019030.mRNA.1.CDS.1 [Saccharomyces cerevisiae]CAI5198888.1 BEM_HP_G0096840.mRNA.1.CDS.1 [Saccharomyces cerevisiae]CAI6760438.1 BEM_HP_G0160210.mRNA.1.CDS.1 [Saccharomyces cerevisiae]
MNKEELLGFLLDDSIDSQKRCVTDQQAYSNWLKNDNDERTAHEESSSQSTIDALNKKKQTEAAQEDIEELLNGLEGIIGGADPRNLKSKSKRKTKKGGSKPREENVNTEKHIVMLEVEDFSDMSTHEDVNGASPSPNLDRSKKNEKRRKNAKELSYDELKDKLEVTTRKSRLECKDLKKKVHGLERRNLELEQRLEELKIENQTLIEINNKLLKNTNEDEINKSQRNKEKDRKRRERRTARRKDERKQEKKQEKKQDNKTSQSFPSSTDMNGQPIEF